MTQRSAPPTPTPPPSSPALVRRGLLIATLGTLACGTDQDGSDASPAVPAPTTTSS